MKSGFLNTTILSDNIKRLRMDNQLSKTKMSIILCVSYKSINLWEKGITTPSLTSIISICNHFDIKMDDLIGLNHNVM